MASYMDNIMRNDFIIMFLMFAMILFLLFNSKPG